MPFLCCFAAAAGDECADSDQAMDDLESEQDDAEDGDENEDVAAPGNKRRRMASTVSCHHVTLPANMLLYEIRIVVSCYKVVPSIFATCISCCCAYALSCVWHDHS